MHNVSHRFHRFSQKNAGMDVNDLTYKIRGAIFKVHKTLGPGLLESVYEAALVYELMQLGLKVFAQVGLPVNYNGGIQNRSSDRRFSNTRNKVS